MFSQALTWANHSPLEGRRQAQWKLLSTDDASLEMTGILRFAKDWNGSVHHALEEELYVLCGELTLGSRPLRRDSYARIPAATTLDWSAAAGTAVIIFLNDEDSQSPVASAPVFIDTTDLRWDAAGVPPELDYMGIRRKFLLGDADNSHCRTWLLATMPQNYPTGEQLERETHGCAEELFMLCGEITGPSGVMSAGAYFWRPPETLHGPFGSREGNLALCRFRHGPTTTQFHRLRLPFEYDAPYLPRLPAQLEHLRNRPGPFSAKF